jgi:2-polyprenyl-3-methyl-5-hydroxy-6-metoxy-1,4-benzoquinol methylase
MIRSESYGQERALTPVDRFGVYLSKRRILRSIGGRTGLAALDIGCGYRASHLLALRPFLRSGTGIDLKIDPQVKALEGFRFIEDTIESAMRNLGDDLFDLILLISVLEHLAQPLEVLVECRRVLRPEGMILINVPTWRGKFYLEFSAFRLGTSPACEMDDHRMYYDVRDLWPLLVQAGFLPSRIRMHYYKFGLNLFARCQK